MIDPSLLARLQKADPATWERIARGIPLKPLGQYFAFDNSKITACQYREAYIPFGELLPEVADAWLQYALQDAIAANDWFFYIQWDKRFGWLASIDEMDDPAEGNSPAEALLRAYLDATEADPCR